MRLPRGGRPNAYRSRPPLLGSDFSSGLDKSNDLPASWTTKSEPSDIQSLVPGPGFLGVLGLEKEQRARRRRRRFAGGALLAVLPGVPGERRGGISNLGRRHVTADRARYHRPRGADPRSPSGAAALEEVLGVNFSERAETRIDTSTAAPRCTTGCANGSPTRLGCKFPTMTNSTATWRPHTWAGRDALRQCRTPSPRGQRAYQGAAWFFARPRGCPRSHVRH